MSGPFFRKGTRRKRTSMSANVKSKARSAAIAGMTGLMALTSLPVAAFADSGSEAITYGTDSIMIMRNGQDGDAAASDVYYKGGNFNLDGWQQADDSGIGYDAYQLFKANITTHGLQNTEYATTDTAKEDTVSNVVWGDSLSADQISTFVDFLKSQGYDKWFTEHTPHGGETNPLNPQKAAEFVSIMINGSASSDQTGDGKAYASRAVDAKTFADNLATWLKYNAKPVGKTTTYINGDSAASQFTNTTGYYLFTAQDGHGTTDGSTVGFDENASAPIFTTIGGSVHQIYEKTSPVTVTKKVQEDSTDPKGKDPLDLTNAYQYPAISEANKDFDYYSGATVNNNSNVAEYGDAADANTGQWLKFRLVGTLPSNLSSYDTYYYGFSDQLPMGMDLEDLSKIKVTAYYTDPASGKLVQGDITSLFQKNSGDMTYDKNTHKLQIWTNDILDTANDASANDGTPRQSGSPETSWPAGVRAGSRIVVDYRACLNENANVGSTGNVNTVRLTYSSNPTLQHNGVTRDIPSGAPDDKPQGTSETPKDSCIVYTYTMRVNKIDKSTREPLQNFAFTIKNDQGEYITHNGSASTNKQQPVATYGADGKPTQTSLADDRIFFTGEDGYFQVKGIDANDTYTLTEIAVAPADYGYYDKMDHDVTIQLTSNVVKNSEMANLEEQGNPGNKLNITTGVADQWIDENFTDAESGVNNRIGANPTPLALYAHLDGLDADLGVIDDNAYQPGGNGADVTGQTQQIDHQTDNRNAVRVDDKQINIDVQAQNVKETLMPITGQAGVTWIIGATGAVVGIGVAALIVRHRRNANAAA